MITLLAQDIKGGTLGLNICGKYAYGTEKSDLNKNEKGVFHDTIR